MVVTLISLHAQSDKPVIHSVMPVTESCFLLSGMAAVAAATICRRIACNKIIHARDYKFDASKNDPSHDGVYLRPFLFLYCKKQKQGWRAKLSIAEFVKWAAVVFLRMAGR
jgi:hypothetical protein